MSASIPTVKLATGLEISKLGFGAMGITAFYGAPMEDEAALTLLEKTLTLGITHFDTAEVYKAGQWGVSSADDKYNETILGRFFATKPRDSFTVATKFHPRVHDQKTDLATVRAALEASLSRLGLAYVDLYYLHRMPDSIDDLLTFMESVKVLVGEGLIKHVGLSEVGPQWLRRAHAIYPIAAVQMEWSLATRILEDSVVGVCRELGIGIVAYSPLVRNLLTLSADSQPPQDWRATNPRYSGENFENNKKVAQRLRDVASRLGATSAQLCLAWLYRRASELNVMVVPIPGSTKIDNVTGNTASVALQLTDADYAEITDIGLAVAGPRGDAGYQSASLEGQLAKQ